MIGKTKSRIKSLFFTLVVVAISKNARALNPSCDTDDPIYCRGGMLQCNYGEKEYDSFFEELDFPFLFDTSKRGMYCDCGEHPDTPGSKGYTGVHCDIHYEVCGDESVCLNGGICEVTSNFQTGKQYHCICPQNERSGDIWVGESCEYKVEEKGICAEKNSVKEVNNGYWFCANGGICNDYEKDLEKKCICQVDIYQNPIWSGLHCEFPGPEPPTPCMIECENGGTCRHGGKDYNMDGLDIKEYLGDNKNIMGQHCVCPEGYSGTFCEVGNLVSCGLQGFCFNGQECLTVRNMEGEVYSEECVCDWDFGGKYCEIEKDGMSSCPAPKGHDKNGYYCANGGVCPPEPFLPCSDCDEGYYGPRCEMHAGDELEPNYEEDCSLDCENGGVCYFGANPKDDDDALLTIPEYLSKGKSSMHCRCPDGFIGLNCEIRFEKCGKDEHFCLHGSTCVSDTDGYTCECEEALGTYAGEYCQSVATEFCTPPGEDQPVHFCTNHGYCEEEIDEDGEVRVQCACGDDFEGEYCETQNLRTIGTASKIFFAFMVILVVGTLGTVIVIKRRGKEHMEVHSLIRPAVHEDEYEERDVQIT